MYTMKSNIQKSKNDKYDRIINRTDELRKEAQKLKSEKNKEDSDVKEKLPIRTFITGRIKGTIIDLNYIERYKNNKLKLDIRLSTGDIIKLSLTDTGEYEEQNELVTLLHTQNISDYAIEDLLGQNIKLKSNSIIYDRSQSVKDITWVVDTPEKFNFVGKLKYKFHILNKLIGNQYSDYIFKNYHTDMIDKIFVLFIVILGSMTIGLGYMLPLSLLNLITYVSFPVILVISSLLVVFTPLLFRTGKHYVIQYKKYMNKDSLKN